jgi:formylglycine-generating enzyme required for sulfatase activity
VDWCDAYAYCKGVGKRLCGKIGGGANAYDEYADANTSQWYKVCSSNGQFAYPYGDTYAGSPCNGKDPGPLTTVPVASLSDCQSSSSGYTGVYDLSGNVWEWEDSCSGTSGTSDFCRVRGGSFYFNGSNLRCDVDYYYARGHSYAYFGFRCCSDP